MWATAACPALSLRTASTTCAPLPARAAAASLPMPDEPPVMMTILPEMSVSIESA